MTHPDLAPTDIVVGIDGSAPSRKALRWAVMEASRRAARLKIITAYMLTWPPEAFGGLGQLPQYAQDRFDQIAAEAVAEARALAPGLEVTGTAVPGEPASQLVDASRLAAMVVVGNRGHGGFASLLLGSVSQHVAAHAAGPIVVVRGHADVRDGPVVVGVDDTPSAQRALELAFEEAERRGCALTAVRGYLTSIPPDDLDATLTPWRDKYPTVAVRAITRLGNPASNLVELSATAGLLIVGSRGHGVLVGSLLGSVGLQLLHHADCPVMIVHTPTGLAR
jgi:nucleotide-binding universal stress UspA family protein